jgi:septal ring factor EnvC (AmiA/AmiB activator)
MRPSAKKYQHEWTALEKLLIVVLLHHSESTHIIKKLIDVNVPNAR